MPLAIPRFPLPAVIAALVLDGVDQTIFQTFTSLSGNYQSYDKALDIYYLTIAYLATLRNWTNLTALWTGRFLLYYRLVGVLVFEWTEERYVLLLFPNTFEYFFIFYELVRLRWDPDRMDRRLVVGMAAAIWIVIKLPQEYWIHVAQRDVTDELAAHPQLIPVLVVIVLALLVAAWWLVTRVLPAADRTMSLAVPDPFLDEERLQAAMDREARRLFDRGLAEKVVLVSLVTVIFSQILPVQSTMLQLSVGVAILIVANTAITEWLERRGIGWQTAMRKFGAMAVVNTGIVLASWIVLPSSNGAINFGTTPFFLLLITLLVTLYDRYRPIYVARMMGTGSGDGQGGAASRRGAVRIAQP